MGISVSRSVVLGGGGSIRAREYQVCVNDEMEQMSFSWEKESLTNRCSIQRPAWSPGLLLRCECAKLASDPIYREQQVLHCCC